MKNIIILTIILLFTFSITITLYSQTREAYLAGTWYPGDKKELRSLLKNYFNNVDLSKNEREIIPFGLLSPHAGLMYSGQIAAYGYSLLQNKEFDTFVLIGSSHNYNNGSISIYDGDYYETPLANTPIDKGITKKILSMDQRFKFQKYIHFGENSLETQVPFIQYQMNKYYPDKNFTIVAILTATNNFRILDKLAQSIINILQDSDKEILLIASSDMAHFHNYETTVDMDRHTIDLILEKKFEALRHDIIKSKSELCGYYAFYTFVKIAQHFNYDDGILLKYANSADVLGNKKASRIVGYCSICFTQSKTKQGSNILPSEKKYLLELARKSIKYYLTNQEVLKPQKPKSGTLTEDRAVFVTLKKDNQLRGCIGQLIAQLPLYKAVTNMAVSAACRDNRFNPLKKSELKDINIEISVLTPMQRISDIEKIRMGIDGVYIKKDYNTGIFLPQVAEETGWNKKTFLENLCLHKASLPKDAYKDEDTEIYIFQVEKFKEK